MIYALMATIGVAFLCVFGLLVGAGTSLKKLTRQVEDLNARVIELNVTLAENTDVIAFFFTEPEELKEPEPIGLPVRLQ